MGILSFPRFEVGLQVLIDAYDCHCKGDIHHYCDRIRPEECRYSLFLDNAFDALGRSQMRAELQALFNHYLLG